MVKINHNREDGLCVNGTYGSFAGQGKMSGKPGYKVGKTLQQSGKIIPSCRMVEAQRLLHDYWLIYTLSGNHVVLPNSFASIKRRRTEP